MKNSEEKFEYEIIDVEPLENGIGYIFKVKDTANGVSIFVVKSSDVRFFLTYFGKEEPSDLIGVNFPGKGYNTGAKALEVILLNLKALL